ncbi:TP901 family phage tail tape measure protein [Bosea sp. OAE506]|uniref:phage tail tape measure protein n=1 Tax=Bosea sp. OAE506 TaxID=2663870 RepID=UPI00178A20AF
MVVAVRAEALITAQNRLRPGLTGAARELDRFRAQQTKATSAFGSTAARAFAAVGGIYAGGRVLQGLNQASKRFAEVDRAMARTGITGDANVRQTREGTEELRNLARDTATLFDPAQKGLDAITSSGRDFTDAMKMMPSVLKTAQASGAGVDDIANTSTALIDHMKISIEGLAEAQDTLAMGGKLGKFELKDQARYLPSLLPAYKAVGRTGQEGLRSLIAMLQVIRSGTGTAEEAAASAQNIFSKMESDETVKNFKEMGVDLPKAMTKARKEGKDLVAVFLELSNKALKGDLSKVPQLFKDMEVQRGMRPLLENLQKILDYTGQLKNAKGTIDKDFIRISADAQATFDRFAESSDRAKTALGALAAEATAPIVKAAADRLNELAQSMERAAAAARDDGFGAAVKRLAKDAVDSVEPYAPKPQDDLTELQAGQDASTISRIRDRGQRANRKPRDPYEAANLDEDIAQAEQTVAATTGPQRERAQLRLDALRNKRIGKVTTFDLTEEEIKAFQRDQIARMPPLPMLPKTAASATPEQAPDLLWPNAPSFDAAREADREARRGKAFRSDTSGQPAFAKGMGQKGLVQPPKRPVELKGAIDIPVQPLEEVQSKVSSVANSFGLLGPAAQTAGSAMATGISSGEDALDRAIAKAQRLQQILNGLKVPPLGGGGGGFDTGRQGPN